MANMNEMTIGEFTDVFNYLLDNNMEICEAGDTPIAVCIEGAAGIGKTSLVKQVAEKRGMTMCTLCLSQLEEVGDIVGFPQKEVMLQYKTKDGATKTVWWPESNLSRVPTNVTVTSNTRMGYAPPAWLPKEENNNGVILLLDDFTRGNSLFQQAIMELINTGSYISWQLPKKTCIVLTSNPDDGEYNVESLDSAQKTRMVTFGIKLDVKDWAKWAEGKVDGRAVNFALLYGNEIFGKHNGVQTVNPRAYTTFCKAIRGIKNWSSDDALGLILNISKGCFLDDKNNTVGTLFTTFISQKLDKLVQPEQMLKDKWEEVEEKIHDCVYEDGRFRTDVASILALRLLNYTIFYFSQKNSKSDVVQNRILDIVNNQRKLFSDDLLFHYIKTIVNKFPTRTNKLLLNDKIRKKGII